jgi:hypothetical protein
MDAFDPEQAARVTVRRCDRSARRNGPRGKSATAEPMLPEEEFFIRKAIGRLRNLRSPTRH